MKKMPERPVSTNLAMDLSRTLLALLLAGGLTACGPAVTTAATTEQPAATEEPATDLQQASIAILSAQCLKCHGPSGSGGISNIADPNSLLAQGLIRSGAPDTSRLIRVVEAGSMPLGAPRMSNPDIETLRTWIAGL